MPITYTIDRVRNLIRTHCVGAVTPEEIADHFRELEQDPNKPGFLNVLLDLTAETSLPVTQQVREVSDYPGKLTPSVKFGACAIVAPTEALFGMMRMFEVMAGEHFELTRVFRSVPEAEQWLDSIIGTIRR